MPKSSKNNSSASKAVKNEKALKESEELMRYIIKYDPNAIAIYDLNLRYIAVSNRYLSDYKVKEEDIIGKHHYDIFPEMPQKWKDVHQRCLEGAIEQNDNDYFDRPDGSVTYNRWECRPWYKADGTIGGIVTYTEVITDRKLAEKALKESEEFSRRIIETADEGILVIDTSDKINFVNSKMAEMLGYPVDEIIGEKLPRFMFPEDVPDLEKKIKERKSGRPGSYERRFIRKDNTVIWVFVSATPIILSDGKYDGSFGMYSDITQRKQALEDLQKSENLLSKIFDILPVGLWIADKNGKLIRSNKKGREIWGAEPLVSQEQYGVFKARRFPSNEDINPSDWALVRSINFGETILDEMLEIDTFDGKKRIILNSTAPVFNEENKVEAGVIVNLDITLQKKSEILIKESFVKTQKTLEGTINTLSSIVEIKDPYTGSHQKNVAKLCSAIAKELGMDKEKIGVLYTCALIHDIGKITIPASILSKPAELSDIEFSMIKAHSQIGHDILSKIDFGYPVADIILQHHERLDGSGYPKGLKGKNILFEARVLAVADTVEAMANHRPYRAALGQDKALEEITASSGTLFDSSVADACIKIFKTGKFKF